MAEQEAASVRGDASSAWRKLIESAMCMDGEAEDQTGAVESLTEGLKSTALGLVELLQLMEDHLTSVNVTRRIKGFTLIANVLQGEGIPKLESQQIHAFVRFCLEKFGDEAVVRPAIQCLKVCICDWEFYDKLLIKQIYDCLSQQVHIPSELQSTRLRALQILRAIANMEEEVVGNSPAEFRHFVMGVVQSVDAERDPRNLMVAFDLLNVTSRKYLEYCSDTLIDEFFDVFSCYFPISFKPSPNDGIGITTEELSRALVKSMLSHTLLASRVFILCCDKLSSQEMDVTQAAIELLNNAFEAFPSQFIDVHAVQVFKTLVVISAASKSQSIVDGCLRTVDTLCRSCTSSEFVVAEARSISSMGIKAAKEAEQRRRFRCCLQVCLSSDVCAKSFAEHVIPELNDGFLSSGEVANARQGILDMSIELSRTLKQSGHDASLEQHHLNLLSEMFSTALVIGQDSLQHSSGAAGLALIVGMKSLDISGKQAALASLLKSALHSGTNMDLRCRCASLIAAVLNDSSRDSPDSVPFVQEREQVTSFLLQCISSDDNWQVATQLLQVQSLQIHVIQSSQKSFESFLANPAHFSKASNLLTACSEAVYASKANCSDDDTSNHMDFCECCSERLLIPVVEMTPSIQGIEAEEKLLPATIGLVTACQTSLILSPTIPTRASSSQQIVKRIMEWDHASKFVLSVQSAAVIHAPAEFIESYAQDFAIKIVNSSFPDVHVDRRGTFESSAALCALACKLGPSLLKSVHDAIFPFLEARITSSDIKSFQAFGWYLRGLAMQCSKLGNQAFEAILSPMLKRTDEGLFVAGVGSAVATVLRKFDKSGEPICSMCLPSHTKQKMVWRQRFFNITSSKLLELASIESNLSACASVLAELCISSHGEDEILAPVLPQVVPLLVNLLYSSTAQQSAEQQHIESILGLLCSILKHDSKQGDMSQRDSSGNPVQSLKENLSTFVPSLLACSTGNFSTGSRCLALDTLVASATAFPFADIYPSRKRLLRDLRPCLDDNLRCIRIRAANARNSWYQLSTSI